MSFATLAAELKKRGNTCVSFDWRGHGGHHCEDEQDLSQETLIAECLYVLDALSTRYPDRSVIMVGHSMGGSIATKTTDKIMREMAGHKF